MVHRFKILFSEPEQSRAIDFRITPDRVIHLGIKRLSRIVVPLFRRMVAFFLENIDITAILFF